MGRSGPTGDGDVPAPVSSGTYPSAYGGVDRQHARRPRPRWPTTPGLRGPAAASWHAARVELVGSAPRTGAHSMSITALSAGGLPYSATGSALSAAPAASASAGGGAATGTESASFSPE